MAYKAALFLQASQRHSFIQYSARLLQHDYSHLHPGWSGHLQRHLATFAHSHGLFTTTEYWLGYRNFYVITRYNRSSFYAMSVFELAEALRTRRATVLARQDTVPR